MTTKNTTTTTETTTTETYESEFVKELTKMDNSYPECKRSKVIRDVFGTGAYLDCRNGHWQISVSL